MLNRKFFFDYVRNNLFGQRLRPLQVSGLTAIIDEWDKSFSKKDDRWLAYMLATTHHETDKTMQPIREYGRGRGRPYGIPDDITGQVYYGRGFVQLTWKRNYEVMSDITGVDLVNEPDRAMELPISTKILFDGMINGRFTGKKLGDYFSATKEDWVSARRIINGLDKANMIADYAKRYYAGISYTI